MNFNTHANAKSSSLVAAFKTEFESRRQYITVSINNSPVRFQLDTTGDITLITGSTWELIGKPDVCTTTHQAQSASGNMLQLSGEVTCNISFKDMHFTGTRHLTDLPHLNLFGLDWIVKLGILDAPLASACNTLQFTSIESTPDGFTSIISPRFSSLFQPGLGCCMKVTAWLHITPNIRPIFRPHRLVPYAALPIVEKELERLEQSGVIRPVNYSSCRCPQSERQSVYLC
ncbi:uncharacterized protein DEA37_0001501 [Paragonimus westermani]|uniref:Peptidase A2 domain-containing protein n=1 Tax=Paragonimus westermani TaxID=34504 RepID=A0A5J4NMM9_9TREM|nr:uncharacterized protein DEA37_0001501 [Paragonimus westermani]